MYDKLEDDERSFYGDLLVEEYDDKNNPIGVETPFGWYVYNIIGRSIDKMQEMSSQFMNDFSILSANPKSLDYFWGLSYNMPRPTLPYSERLLTDDEYRIYLYLRNCQLITERDILVCMGKAFGFNDYEVSMDVISSYLETTDHLNYTSIEYDGSNLHKTLDDATKQFVTNHEEDEDTEVFESKLSESADTIQVVKIPYNGWDPEFLEFMEQYISVKGDLRIMEYQL